MADTFAQRMVAKYQQVLLDNPGAQSVTLPDGITVTYANLVRQLQYWERRVAREAGTRPRAAAVDLSNF